MSSLRLLVAVFGVLGCCAPLAGAATLGVDRRCYLAGQSVTVDGSGFFPGVPVALLSAGQLASNGPSDQSGGIHRKVPAPALLGGQFRIEQQVWRWRGAAANA